MMRAFLALAALWLAALSAFLLVQHLVEMHELAQAAREREARQRRAARLWMDEAEYEWLADPRAVELARRYRRRRRAAPSKPSDEE